MKSILRSKMKLSVLVLGWILLLVGVLGLLLPLLPGIPPLLAGLVILSRQYDWARRTLARVQRWLPAVSDHFRLLWLRIGMHSSDRVSESTSTCEDAGSPENQ